MTHEQEVDRHYWLPVPDQDALIRHAFRGRRWLSQPSETSVCGRDVAMAQPSELDWCRAPTCLSCNDILKNQRPG